jgi:hypothetical protein
MICQCRHTREAYGSRVWPGDPRAAAGGSSARPGAGQADGPCGVLPGGTSDIGGDDINSVPVQAAAGTVIPHRGPGIGVRGGFLHIAQRHPSVQRRGDERMPQRVRPNRLAHIITAGYPAHDPGRAMAVQSAGIGG